MTIKKNGLMKIAVNPDFFGMTHKKIARHNPRKSTWWGGVGRMPKPFKGMEMK
jgi:hypothetical protein